LNFVIAYGAAACFTGVARFTPPGLPGRRRDGDRPSERSASPVGARGSILPV